VLGPFGARRNWDGAGGLLGPDPDQLRFGVARRPRPASSADDLARNRLRPELERPVGPTGYGCGEGRDVQRVAGTLQADRVAVTALVGLGLARTVNRPPLHAEVGLFLFSWSLPAWGLRSIGSTIPLRSDPAAELAQWIKDEPEAKQADTGAAIGG